MHGYFIIPLAFLFFAESAAIFANSAIATREPNTFMIQSEYRRDALDFEDTTKEFYRERIGISFSGASRFNFTYAYLTPDKVHRYTWNLALNDISPFFTFIFGYYYAHFGSGLLLGRKGPYNHDFLSVRREISESGIFTPCTSGNPFHAFNGTGASFRAGTDDAAISFSAFYSIKNRFTGPDSIDSGGTVCNLSTLDYKNEKKFPDNEPAEIHSHGGNLTFTALRLFTLQAYYSITKVMSASGDNLRFDAIDSGGARGIDRLYGLGFFARYRDDCIDLFAERAMTARHLSVRGGDDEKDTAGYGGIIGLRIIHPRIKLSIIGKKTDSDFYAPYGSSIGDDHPESAWFFDIGTRPMKEMTIGGSASSEKIDGSSCGYDGSPVMKREKVFIDYTGEYIKKASLAFGNMRKTSDNTESKSQIKSLIHIEFLKEFSAEVSYMCQYGNQYGRSDLYMAGISLTLSSVTNSLFYARAEVSDSNEIYTAMLPVQNSNVPGVFIKKDSDIIAWKLIFKYGGIYLSARYLRQFIHSAEDKTTVEFFASGKF
jgi:hypothetical protein